MFNAAATWPKPPSGPTYRSDSLRTAQANLKSILSGEKTPGIFLLSLCIDWIIRKSSLILFINSFQLLYPQSLFFCLMPNCLSFNFVEDASRNIIPLCFVWWWSCQYLLAWEIIFLASFFSSFVKKICPGSGLNFFQIYFDLVLFS